MYMVVVSIRQHGCELVPVFLVFVNVIAQHRQDLPVVALHLPIRLGVVCRRKDIRYSKQLAHCLEELSSELLTFLRYDALRGSIRKDPVLNEGYDNVISCDLTQQYDARKFRESVGDHE